MKEIFSFVRIGLTKVLSVCEVSIMKQFEYMFMVYNDGPTH